MSNTDQKGFAHLALLVLALGVLGLIFLSNQQNLSFLKGSHDESKVQGVLLARGGDDAPAPGTTITSTESHDLGTSGSGSPESPRPEGVELHSMRPLPLHAVENKERVELKKDSRHGGRDASRSATLEDENENEAENEVENEVEKPEVHKVEFKRGRGGLEVEVREASGESRKVASGSARVKLNSKKGGKEIEVEIRGADFRIKVSSQSATTKFPISFDKETGVLSVETGKGLKEIRILPDQASAIAQKAGVQQKLGEAELVEETNPATPDDLAFKVQGTRQVRLLGLIPVTANIETEVGAETGQVLGVEEPWWVKFLSLK